MKLKSIMTTLANFFGFGRYMENLHETNEAKSKHLKSVKYQMSFMGKQKRNMIRHKRKHY